MKKLPPNFDVETKAVLKKAIEAERTLGKLKGVVQKIPNEAIILNTLSLQEVKVAPRLKI